MCHIRIDSSPQHSKDYLMGEIDYYPVDSDDVDDIHTRLLAPQVLAARKTTLWFKAYRLSHQLLLKFGHNYNSQLSYVRSILFDMGTESRLVGSVEPSSAIDISTKYEKDTMLWGSHQSLTSVERSCLDNVFGTDADADEELQDPIEITNVCSHFFPNALGIPDSDHALHHIIRSAEDFLDFVWILEVLRALAGYFRSWTRIQHFTSVTVDKNTMMDECDRQQYRRLFKARCPYPYEGRWQFLNDVANWILDRRNAICTLWMMFSKDDAQTSTRKVDAEDDNYSPFTLKEYNMIALIADISSAESFKFWITLDLLSRIANWGSQVRGFLHGCLCHGSTLEQKQASKDSKNNSGRRLTPCKKSGRRLIEWVSFKYDEFKNMIQHLEPAASTRDALRPDADDSDAKRECKQWALREFTSARNTVALQFIQRFDWGLQLPWSIFSIFQGHIIPTAYHSQHAKTSANKVCDDYDTAIRNKSEHVSNVSHKFMRHGSQLRMYIDHFRSSHEATMHPHLAAAGMEYGSALMVMQRLERTHNIVNNCLRHAPNMSVLGVIVSPVFRIFSGAYIDFLLHVVFVHMFDS